MLSTIPSFPAGTVVTASDRILCDVAIKDGKIVALGSGLTGADEVIDASGKLVLPGGVDAHVHIAQPRRGHRDGGRLRKRHPLRGPRAGTTTVMPFCLQEKGQGLRAA